MSERRSWAYKTTPGSDHEFCTIYEDCPSGRAVARHVTPEHAELIVRTRNAHDNLLEACRRYLRWLESELENFPPGSNTPWEAKARDVRAVIAKAQGDN